MSFNYISNPAGLKLDPQEEFFLEKIDNFSYALNGYANLAQLHNTITVELSDEKNVYKKIYEISEEERKSMLEEIEVKIKELKDELNIEQDEKKTKRLKEEIDRLSDIEDSLKQANKLPDGRYEFIIIVNCPILGEYVSSKKKIILYINTIRNGKNPCMLLGEVYVHEMMHAYLDCGHKEYFTEIEEPIAEYGMLRFFKSFNDKSILRHAKNSVRNKQKYNLIAHYGFGLFIFLKDNGEDFLDLYRNAKPTLTSSTPSTPNISNYLKFWNLIYGYPEDELMCLVMLYLSLTSSTDIYNAFKTLLPTRKVPTSPSKNGNDYSKYMVNGYGPYAKTETILLAVCLYVSNYPTEDAGDVVAAWGHVYPNLVMLTKHVSKHDPIKRDRKLLLPNGNAVYVSNQSRLSQINDIMINLPVHWGITIVQK